VIGSIARGAVIAGALCAVCPSAAVAQVRAVQVSAGYSAMRDTNDHLTFKAGWNAGASAAINNWLAFVADVDRQTTSVPTFDGGSFTLSSQALLGGFRASGRLGVFTEFGQILVGRVTSHGAVFGVTSTTHHTALQPGLGLDMVIPKHGRWAVRGTVDARFLDSGREALLGIGLVCRVH
jgi:hypothetical protein